MATIHIPESEAAARFSSLMESIRAGTEVVIESGDVPIAVLAPPPVFLRTLKERIALLPEDSSAVMDEDFARDVAAAIEAHREPLDPPAWD